VRKGHAGLRPVTSSARAAGPVMSSRRSPTGRLRRFVPAVILPCLVACGASEPAPESRPAVPAAATLAPRVPPASPPIALDTALTAVLELWPLAVAPGKQLEETRRIVEHLHADLARTDGFDGAALLASGDGTALVLVARWRDSSAADSAEAALAGWLNAERDTAARRRRFGSATPRVRVRRTVGTPPSLTDAAMLLLTRYAVKPGHSFGALAALTDSNLATRVLQDTAAQGGASLATRDSGALYMVMQARTATALDPTLQQSGPLPFWAPFAVRTESLLAVVAVVPGRSAP
jgi:hypothetical protein